MPREEAQALMSEASVMWRQHQGRQAMGGGLTRRRTISTSMLRLAWLSNDAGAVATRLTHERMVQLVAMTCRAWARKGVRMVGEVEDSGQG